MKKFVCTLLVLLTLIGAAVAQSDPVSVLVNHRGQDLFLNGINLAWINFGRDLQSFDEVRFVAALDELADARGNTLRWWLHTNGSTSPLYGEDGRVIGLGESDIRNLQRAAALAYERGILLMPTLWSHDMLNEQGNVPTAANKLMIEDPAYTQAYIEHALIPLVEGLRGYPGIVAWEIFNEPEGTTREYGWTDQRTDMRSIQQFVNLLAGAIHRADPDALVTNGSWNMRVLTDLAPFTNYYRDDRLIEAGGDADGTLDFYSVHYYPEHFDESTSPFHNPYAHWQLDKPLVVGEFPAKAIMDLGMGFLPRTRLRNSIESYSYLIENGYAGALAWTFYNSPHGSMLDARAGIRWMDRLAPDSVLLVNIGEIDRIPVLQQPVENAIVNNDVPAIENYADLTQIFSDAEDGSALSYALVSNSQPDLVAVSIAEDGKLSLSFPSGMTGTAVVAVSASDSASNSSQTTFSVQVVDPNRGNVALGKLATASTEENSGHLADYAVDGLMTTRWSTEYTDGQWLDVDLGAVFTISQVVLKWEAAFGDQYQIQVWDGSAWQTVFEEITGDGDVDDITLAQPVDTRFVRMNGIRRGEEWGFSLWEFEIYGVAAEVADAALETLPESFVALANAPQEETSAPAEIVVSEETLLNSFEQDIEGWKVADYWSGGTGLTVSSEQATAGAQSLQLDATLSGTAWQEAGAFYTLPAAADWSAFTQLAVDIYLPEGATDFIAQIFIKTGSDWTWANTPDTGLTAGGWTTLVADLSTMGDLTQVREYGIKVGTSVTAFSGGILVDNVRLQQVSAQATSAEPAPIAEATVNAISSVSALTETVGRYERYEAAIDLDAAFSNPYDPLEIRVEAQFTAPSGTVLTVPAFYYRDFTYNGSRVSATDDVSWRVRFTPQEVGDYSYTVSATAANGTVSSEPVTFTVSESDRRGFVRVDARNPRYFAFDDGSPYFPIGLNMAWSTGNTIGDYETWLDELQASGGNFIRVWMAPWNMTIEWIDTGLGNYERRQFRAYELDRVIELAAERDIYIMLTLLNHGQFNTSVNPEWDQNPYNAANGGPCDTPQCFATDPEAIRYWEQRVRYIVARWGYSPNIMTWEWWNEINWTPLAGEPILAPWMERNSALIRELDPYDHLLTHSGSPVAAAGVWEPLDFTQDHFYDRDDFPRTFLNANEEWQEAYPEKPFLAGEFGRASEALSYDLEGLELHLGIWSAPMTGAAGTAMTWWWDTYVHPNDLWERLFKGVSTFFAGEDLAAYRWQRPEAEFAERTRARIFGLQSADAALLWIVSRDYSTQYLESAYLANLRNKVEDPFDIEFPLVEPAPLLLSTMQAGDYSVAIYDPLSGEILSTQTVSAVEGVLTLTLPAFERDLALKIRAQ